MTLRSDIIETVVSTTTTTTATTTLILQANKLLCEMDARAKTQLENGLESPIGAPRHYYVKLAVPTLRAAARALKKPVPATILALSKPKQFTNDYPTWLPELFNDKNSTVCADKAHQILQWRSDVSLAEGQKRSIDWLRHIFAEDFSE